MSNIKRAKLDHNPLSVDLESRKGKMPKQKNKNAFTQIRNCQIYGRKKFGRVEQLPRDFFSEEKTSLAKIVIDSVYGMTAIRNQAKEKTLLTFTSDVKKLISALIPGTPEEPASTGAAELVCSFELVEGLLEFLVSGLFHDASTANMTSPTTLNRSQRMPPFPKEKISTATSILQVVYECFVQVPGYSVSHLRRIPGLLEALFSLLAGCNNNIPSLINFVLEEVLLCGSESPSSMPIVLKDIKGLADMIENLKGNTLCQFCHLLSAVMSDIEFVASSHNSLEKHDQWLHTSGSGVTQLNHEFLLRIPLFLEKMCATLCRPLHSSDGTQPVDFVTQILTQALGLDETEFSRLIEYNHDESDSVFIQMSLIQEKTTRADLFLIISLLLSGKFREEVQSRLVRCRFVQSLHKTFRSIVWENPLNNNFHQVHEGPGHEECSPNTVIRIQFLRLMHSVADSHANRYLLLSTYEAEKLKAYAVEHNLPIPDDLRDLQTSTLYDGEEGMLSQIVSLLRQELPTSCVRFWITRAMEAFLRGGTCPLDQAFLLEKKLIEESMSLVLSTDARVDTVMQGNFDFLSTIMRRNVRAFVICERTMDCTAKFQLLLDVIDDSLVDSNMFVRCVILTIHHVRRNEPQHIGALSSSRLLRHFDDFNYRVKVAARLIRLLTVPTLSQENVSCLNTSLLVLILAHREGKLPAYLAGLRDMVDGCGLLRNLEQLLKFWDAHYNLPMKKTDCKSLETSSGVKFEEWRSVVSLLLSSDPVRTTSIRHHLENPLDILHTTHNVLQCNRTS